jgi:hypothetical protein
VLELGSMFISLHSTQQPSASLYIISRRLFHRFPSLRRQKMGLLPRKIM